MSEPELRQGDEEIQPELTDATAVIVGPENKSAAELTQTEDTRVKTNENIQPELTKFRDNRGHREESCCRTGPN